MTKILLPTHRHEFEDETMDLLREFSQLHQFDDRKQFKESWIEWQKHNADIIVAETHRLSQNGFAGDVVDKMFKSARYYFRKKKPVVKQPRKKTIGFSGSILTEIDLHIIEQIKSTTGKRIDVFVCTFSPEQAYVDFCETKQRIIQAEIAQLLQDDPTSASLLERLTQKCKKTYKNRYQMIRKKIQDKT
jgi:hypothetical protein